MNRLLLLEDDLSLIDGLQYSLKKNGFDTEVARTVREAMTRLPEISRYDLLILDVTLPDGTGFDFCERVRKSGSLIPVIFLKSASSAVWTAAGTIISQSLSGWASCALVSGPCCAGPGYKNRRLLLP